MSRSRILYRYLDHGLGFLEPQESRHEAPEHGGQKEHDERKPRDRHRPTHRHRPTRAQFGPFGSNRVRRLRVVKQSLVDGVAVVAHVAKLCDDDDQAEAVEDGWNIGEHQRT